METREIAREESIQIDATVLASDIAGRIMRDCRAAVLARMPGGSYLMNGVAFKTTEEKALYLQTVIDELKPLVETALEEIAHI
jgi:hypothetical protein